VVCGNTIEKECELSTEARKGETVEPERLVPGTSSTILLVLVAKSNDLCAVKDDVDYLPMAKPNAPNSFGDPPQSGECSTHITRFW
jgi:hypothetical protein